MSRWGVCEISPKIPHFTKSVPDNNHYSWCPKITVAPRSLSNFFMGFWAIRFPLKNRKISLNVRLNHPIKMLTDRFLVIPRHCKYSKFGFDCKYTTANLVMLRCFANILSRRGWWRGEGWTNLLLNHWQWCKRLWWKLV